MNKSTVLKSYTFLGINHSLRYNQYLFYELNNKFKNSKPPHFFHKKSAYILNYYKKL